MAESKRDLSPKAPPHDLRDLSQGLSIAALAMASVFVLALLASVLPGKLNDPAWQQGMLLALVDNAVIPLVALIVLHGAAWMNPGDLFSRGLRDGAARWAVPVALGFVLLVPLQGLLAWRSHDLDHRAQHLRLREVDQRFALLRQAVAQAESSADLQTRLQQVVGPSFGSINPQEPLPQLRKKLSGILDQNQRQLRLQLQVRAQQGSAPSLLPQPLRVAVSCLAYGVAFAALARRRNSEISLLASCLFAPLGRPGRFLQRPGELGLELEAALDQEGDQQVNEEVDEAAEIP